ncbi:SAVMC3_10250 family protein [Streptomyces echinatus]|uniref:SAVMC3_10250 family protein n=1 Tax=Streptomyces echinatus TaxID=67293 RepID=UPI003809A979
MREFVYLSKRKLRQFTESNGDVGRPRWWRRLGFEGELAFPPFGRAKVAGREATAEPVTLTVDEVIDEFERGDRAAGWFADDSVGAGSWALFEAPLNYRVMDDKYFRSAVLFLDSAVRSPHYPTGGSVRLLLHGSREHLLGMEGSSPVRLDVQAELDRSEPEEFHVASDSSYLYRLAGQSFSLEDQTVERLLPDLSDRLLRNDELSRELGRTSLRIVYQHRNFATGLRMTVRLLDEAFVPETAAWMRGYARITSRTDLYGNGGEEKVRLVTATPLYVEYAPQP